MAAHEPALAALAALCTHVTEFGVRAGNSTRALLAGLPPFGRMVSYDIRECPAVDDPRWTFRVQDTAAFTTLIEPTDLLFIDTLHDCDQVAAELQHAPMVRRFLVFHDTVMFGSMDESTGRPPGINHAIWSFLAGSSSWRVRSHDWRCCGLLVLERS